jgi:uncharacterized membrane protein YgcG
MRELVAQIGVWMPRAIARRTISSIRRSQIVVSITELLDSITRQQLEAALDRLTDPVA